MRQWTPFCLLTTFLLLGHLCFGQTNQKKTYNIQTPSDGKVSECLTNCSIQSEVISSKLTNNLLTIKVGAHLNCSVNSSSQITYSLHGDTLNIVILEFQIKRDTTISKTDSSQTVTIYETIEWTSTRCKCFFHIDLVIKNCDSMPKIVLINGDTLADNYNDRTIIEMEK